MIWSGEEVELLRKLYLENKELKEISEILKGRSAKAISHKVSRLDLVREKLPPNRSRRSRNEYDNNYYIRNRIRIQENRKKRIRKRKEWLVGLLGGKCAKCGYIKCISALDFHHRSDKEEMLSRLIKDSSKQKVLKEVKKCILLCANCHRELHAQGDIVQ